MQQRLRVAADTVQKDLMMAGAGTYSGFMVGTLDNYFAPILPHRVGTINADPAGIVSCQRALPDHVRVGHHDHVRAQHQRADDDPHRHADAVGRAEGAPAARLSARTTATCAGSTTAIACSSSIRAARTTSSPSPTCRTTRCTCSTATTSSRRSTTPAPGSRRVESHTYYLNEVPATNTYELRHYDGYQTDLPVVDNVVDFRVEFFGDPLPPQMVRPVSDPVGPWTTYGPKPPAIGIDNDKDPWGAGENCVFQVDGTSGLQVARPQIQTLGTALDGPVPLTAGDADRRSVVPLGDQHGRRRHAEQVRRRLAPRAAGPRDAARAGGKRRAARSGRRALPPRRPLERAASASSRTRKSASTCRRAT